MSGRGGSQWRRLRARVLLEERTCGICGFRACPHARGVLPMTGKCRGLDRPNQGDHIVRVADGGSLYDRNNVRAAHGCCNGRRNYKPDAELRRGQWVDDDDPGRLGTPSRVW